MRSSVRRRSVHVLARFRALAIAAAVFAGASLGRPQAAQGQQPPTAAPNAPGMLPAGVTAQPLAAVAPTPVASQPAAPPVVFMPAVAATPATPAAPVAMPAVALNQTAALPPLYSVPQDGPLSIRRAAPIATVIPGGTEGLTVAAMAAPTVQPISTKLHNDSLNHGLRNTSSGYRGCAVVPGGGPCDPITQVSRPPQLCGRCSTPDSWEMDDCYCGTMRTHALHDLFNCGQFVVGAGVSIPSAGGVLGDRLLTGWGIDIAMRSPILPPQPNRRWFGELGVSFMQNGGKGSAITTSGTFVDANGFVPFSVQLDELFQTEIRDIRRTAFTTGLGMTILPTWLNQNRQRLISIVPRAGIRWGGAHVSYRETPTADLAAVIAGRPPGNDPANFQYFSDARRTDTFFGVYGSLGVQATWCHVPVFCLCVREFSLGAQLQYVNDWLDLGVLTGGTQKTISTVSPMLTLAVGF